MFKFRYLGYTKFAEALQVLEGKPHVNRYSPIRNLFNSCAQHFNFHRKNYDAAERLIIILRIAYETPTGRAAIAFAAAHKLSVAFDESFKAGYANVRGFPATVKVSPQDSDGYIANLIIHEIRHQQQAHNVKLALGDRNAYTHKAIALADTAYPMILQEADAFTTQVINAYEMYEKDEYAAWHELQNTLPYRPLVDALTDQLHRGKDLHADSTKQAILDAWMKKSNWRLSYDEEYLTDIATKPAFIRRLQQPGLSHTQAELAAIARDNGTSSYLDKLSLTDASYLGIWGELKSGHDILPALDLIEEKKYFYNQYDMGLSLIDTASALLKGWRLKPVETLARIPTHEALKNMEIVIRNITALPQLAPLERSRFALMLDDAAYLAKQNPYLKRIWEPAIKSGIDYLQAHKTAVPALPRLMLGG